MNVEIPSEGDPPAQSNSDPSSPDKPSSAESSPFQSHLLEGHPLEVRFSIIKSELERHTSDEGLHRGMTMRYNPTSSHGLLWSYKECEKCTALVQKAVAVDVILRALSFLVQT